MRTAVRVLITIVALAGNFNLSGAEEPQWSGRWKLVASPLTDTELVLIEVTTSEDKLDAKVLASAPAFMSPAATLTRNGQQVSLVLKTDKLEDRFDGALVMQGPREGQVLGTLRFRDRFYPARLEPTKAEELGRAKTPPGMADYLAAMRESNTQARVEKLREAVKEAQGPIAAAMYTTILQNADSADLSSEEVLNAVNALLTVGKEYGAPIVIEYRERALKALKGKKPYADLTLSLALDADQTPGSSATLEQQATVLAVLATSARLLDKLDLAAATDARLAKIEATLDQQYHSKVPPFTPQAYSGRSQAGHDRVVLMELFTGAQCPPCVAADVAFDALIKSYRPSELVTLQHHLHIPGPDPLTNADTEARARYYGANSTPSTFFNGESGARGGGGMANAEAKYGQYRELIDAQLANSRRAKVDLQVSRSGQQLMVTAAAQTVKPKENSSGGESQPNTKEAKPKLEKAEEPQKSDTSKPDDKPSEPQLRLRLVLTEESIRYVGGNQLRFHHHVVRSFPGGVDGREFVGDECTMSETIDLDQLRKSLSDYVEARDKKTPFANAAPTIELKNLSLVAFVQNDVDKSIWHAVTVPVENE